MPPKFLYRGNNTLIGPSITAAVGMTANIGQSNSSSFLLRVNHKFTCPISAIIPNTVSLVGFHWNNKPLAGGQSLEEDKEKVELTRGFEKCDENDRSF